jgi:hypothetical protein
LVQPAAASRFFGDVVLQSVTQAGGSESSVAARAFGKAHRFAYDARSIPQRCLQGLQTDQEET